MQQQSLRRHLPLGIRSNIAMTKNVLRELLGIIGDFNNNEVPSNSAGTRLRFGQMREPRTRWSQIEKDGVKMLGRACACLRCIGVIFCAHMRTLKRGRKWCGRHMNRCLISNAQDAGRCQWCGAGLEPTAASPSYSANTNTSALRASFCSVASAELLCPAQRL